MTINQSAEYLTNYFILAEFTVIALGLSLFMGVKFWVNFYIWLQQFGI